jgi:LPXTG-motif cell wall-anchored protein
MNANPPINGAIPDYNYILFGAIVIALIVGLIIWLRRRR